MLIDNRIFELTKIEIRCSITSKNITGRFEKLQIVNMSSGTFVDRIDPFAKRSLKKKPKKSQGSSRYRTGGDVELTALPLLKGKLRYQ